MGREMPYLRPLRPQLCNNGYYFGNNITGFLENDGIADADILLFNEILVVEGRAGDRGARDRDRPQVGDWCELPRAAYLKHDILHYRLNLFGRKFICDGETRRLTGVAERFLCRMIFNL